MAQFGVLIYAHDSAHALDAAPADIESCDEHSDELAEEGSKVAAFALTPRDTAKSIRAEGITDGPFVDANDIVAGFYVIEASDLDEAVKIAGTNPVVRYNGGVEVRAIHSSYMEITSTYMRPEE
jgi:hypothetical protein